MRKIYAIIMTLALVLCMGPAAVYAVPATDSGAGEAAHAAEAATSENTSGSQAGQQVSEWVIAENEAAALPEDVQTVFSKAAESFNGEMVPVAYFARQLVLGSYYQVLCRVTAAPEQSAGDTAAKTSEEGKTDAAGSQAAEGSEASADTAKPVTSYKVAVISMDLLGNVRIERMSDFNIADYTGLTAEKEGVAGDGTAETAGSKDDRDEEMNKTPVAAEPADPDAEIPAELLGGWTVPADYTKIALPEEVKAAFDKGAEQFFGNELVPMAYLGRQTAEGTNYAVLCHSLLTTAEAVESVQVVMIYQDNDGNAYITSANTVDPVSFVKEEQQAEDGGDAAAKGAESPEKSSD